MCLLLLLRHLLLCSLHERGVVLLGLGIQLPLNRAVKLWLSVARRLQHLYEVYQLVHVVDRR